MPIFKTKYPMNSENGSGITSGCGGQGVKIDPRVKLTQRVKVAQRVTLAQIDSFEDIRLALAYGPARYRTDRWENIEDCEAKYFNELKGRVLKRKNEQETEFCLVFMAEI